MGKTAGSSKSKSSHSSNKSSKTKMNVQMSSYKAHKKMKKSKSKMIASINKVFNQLRSESMTSFSSLDNSVVVVDNSPKKRKLSPTHSENSVKRKKNNEEATTAPIVIHDDSTLERNDALCDATLTPRKPLQMHCSTPIIKKPEPDFIPLVRKSSEKINNNMLAAQNLNNEIQDLTKEINKDSYLTIDLTTETLNCSAISKPDPQNTVIDLEATNDDCTVISVSNANLSLSGESDVTVLNLGPSRKDKQLNKFVKGIAKLDASEKGRLLELITQNIFSGCKVASKGKGSQLADNSSPKPSTSRATETAEHTYIKEVILGQAPSRNSIGSNIYNPEKDDKNKTGLRMIVIDGSNVAMEHSRGRQFSVKGLKICIEYFLKRGHVVKAFVPRFRCKFGKSSDPRLLDDLERRGLVIYTPSREIQGRMVTSYDDRYIVQCAAEFDGIIVSGDNYRDLLRENPRWRTVIETRLLPFTWVNDMIMFPKDPLGRNGPSLEQFLRHPGK